MRLKRSCRAKSDHRADVRIFEANASTVAGLTAPVRLVAGTVKDVARVPGQCSTFGRATVDRYGENVTVSSLKVQHELGFVPRYDVAAGWRDSVQEMERGGVV